MKDIEQYLRENVPETPEEGQFLLETNARLSAVEGIKKTVDGAHRRLRIALVVSLAAGLALGCVVTLLVIFFPVPSVRDGHSVLMDVLASLQSGEGYLFGVIACFAIALGVLLMSRKRELL